MDELALGYPIVTIDRMSRILMLERDSPFRAQLIETIERTPNAFVVPVADEQELLDRIHLSRFAAVFADDALLPNGVSGLLNAVRSASSRPMLVVASSARAEDLDPDLVTLVVRKPYDVQSLTGILISAVMQVSAAGDSIERASVC
jgi:hypothetical protein